MLITRRLTYRKTETLPRSGWVQGIRMVMVPGSTSHWTLNCSRPTCHSTERPLGTALSRSSCSMTTSLLWRPVTLLLPIRLRTSAWSLTWSPSQILQDKFGTSMQAAWPSYTIGSYATEKSRPSRATPSGILT